ncbi:hypothetical protein G7046_g1998 [Stylonectria norvegica]|nr:hypothetical protein G7046_g1998 [Stylonectria norvegica]
MTLLFTQAPNQFSLDQCDERTPKCLHCIRRQEHCEWRRCKYRDASDLPSVTERPDPQESCKPTAPIADTSMINLLHMKLFHHFETRTRHTLTFDTVWEDAIRLSFRCESLMHAILCLSAKHLAFLQPDDPQHEMSAATHLSQTLQLFQHDLSKAVTTSNVDCFLSTATLLSYIVWDETECVSTDANSSVTVSCLDDRLFSIGGGTLEVFMSANFWISWNQSIFVPHVNYSPRLTLCDSIGLTSATIDLYLIFFEYRRPLTIDRLSIPNLFDLLRAEHCKEHDMTTLSYLPEEPADIADAYIRVVQRLCVILSFLPEMRNPESDKAHEECLPDLARYIFSFPIMCSWESQALARGQHLKWWLILYHFYRAARILLPTQFWWAQRRSRFMEPLLGNLLLDQCVHEVQPPANVGQDCREDDLSFQYFTFRSS